MFYSKTTGGFYNEEIHGAKMFAIHDPAWVRPTISVSQDDGNGGIVIVEVPDENAEHPTITIPNPDCKIPADAVEITEVEYTALLDAQSNGKRIQADANGNPVVVDQPKATAAEMWELIKAHRDHLTETGGYKVGTKWYHSDQKSRSQQLGLVLLGANIPENTQWKTLDGSFILMTQTLSGQILVAAAVSDMTIFAAAEAHKSAMEASADPSAYDFSTGWPVVYTG